MSDEKLETVSVDVKVRCTCGELHEFDSHDLLPTGVRTSLQCEGCGRTVAVDAEVWAQYLPSEVSA